MSSGLPRVRWPNSNQLPSRPPMCSLLRSLLFTGVLCSVLAPAAGAQIGGATPPPSATIQQLADKVRDAIVVVTFAGRDGNRQGLGTGFVIDKRGLIATNLHVIGE